MPKKAIVLLSGGIDSATCLYVAKRRGFEPYCLIFDYGQSHIREVESAKKIAQVAKAKFIVCKINFPWKGSSLIDPRLKIPKRSKGIPSTYVPARNTVFLSFALSFAETIGAKTIFIGANAVDFSVAINSKIIKKGEGIIPIQKCKSGDYILSMDKKTLKIRWSKVKGLLKHEYIGQPMYKIITEHGRNIIVSNGHSLFFLNRKGEIQPTKVEDLRKGDYILAPSKLRMFGNIKEINLLELLSDEQSIFVTHPKLGSLIQKYKNEQERRWKRSNIMPLNVYNKLYRKRSSIKDGEIFIKSRHDRKRCIPAILKLNKVFCFFLGLWLADGNFGSRNSVCISCRHSEAIRNFKIICKFFKAKMSVKKNKVDGSASSPLLMKIMKRMGFVGTARTKIIPTIIYDLPLELQSAFLRGFIIGDGSVKKGSAIDISLVNKSLIDDLQNLLLNFGIIAYKKKQFYKKTNFIDRPFWLYRLAIENSIDKQLFLENIGNINNNIAPLASYRSKIRGIPAYETLNDDLKSIRTFKKFTAIKNMIRNNAIYTKNRFERKLLLKLISQTPSGNLKEKWSSLSNNELIFVRIKQKRRARYQYKYIYDVSVEKNENFICGGLIAHNSGYPDCRPEFYRAYRKVAKTGIKNKEICILTPLINKTKAQIIKLGQSLGVPYELSWSCYRGRKRPCGQCDSCRFRAKGFREAGIQDPLL